MTVATPLWRMHLVLSTHEPTGWASFEIEKSFFYCFIEIDSWVDLISLGGFGGLTMNRNRTICLLTGDGFCSDPPGENWEVGLMAPITEPLVELFWKLSDIIRLFYCTLYRLWATWHTYFSFQTNFLFTAFNWVISNMSFYHHFCKCCECLNEGTLISISISWEDIFVLVPPFTTGFSYLTRPIPCRTHLQPRYGMLMFAIT